MRDLGSRASGVGVRVPMPAPNERAAVENVSAAAFLMFYEFIHQQPWWLTRCAKVLVCQKI